MKEGPISNLAMDYTVSWNTDLNTPSITFELGMKKIQEEVRKYVVSMRFEKIQSSLKFFQEYRLKEEKLGRKFKIA